MVEVTSGDWDQFWKPIIRWLNITLTIVLLFITGFFVSDDTYELLEIGHTHFKNEIFASLRITSFPGFKKWTLLAYFTQQLIAQACLTNIGQPIDKTSFKIFSVFGQPLYLISIFTMLGVHTVPALVLLVLIWTNITMMVKEMDTSDDAVISRQFLIILTVYILTFSLLLTTGVPWNTWKVLLTLPSFLSLTPVKSDSINHYFSLRPLGGVFLFGMALL